MISSLLLLILLAVLIQVVPMDGKVKHILNLIVIVLAVVVLLFSFPWPPDWYGWPRR